MKHWADSIPWIIAVIGYFITHVFSEARERRKDIRSQLDKISTRLQQLEVDARAFHTAKEFESTKNLQLITGISQIERHLSRLAFLLIDNLNGPIIHMRRAITLENFDRSNFKTQEVDSEIFHEISAAIGDLEDAVEREYRLAFPNTFPYFRLKNTNIIKTSKYF